MENFVLAEFIDKFLRFGLVGFSGVFVDFGVTYLGKEFLKIQKFIANALGFIIAASSNYVLNRIWTFESTNPEVMVEYTQFMLISIVGLAINTAVIYWLNEKIKWNFYFAKIFAIGTATLWNFFANAYITFG